MKVVRLNEDDSIYDFFIVINNVYDEDNPYITDEFIGTFDELFDNYDFSSAGYWESDEYRKNKNLEVRNELQSTGKYIGKYHEVACKQINPDYYEKLRRTSF